MSSHDAEESHWDFRLWLLGAALWTTIIALEVAL